MSESDWSATDRYYEKIRKDQKATDIVFNWVIGIMGTIVILSMLVFFIWVSIAVSWVIAIPFMVLGFIAGSIYVAYRIVRKRLDRV